MKNKNICGAFATTQSDQKTPRCKLHEHRDQRYKPIDPKPLPPKRPVGRPVGTKSTPRDVSKPPLGRPKKQVPHATAAD